MSPLFHGTPWTAATTMLTALIISSLMKWWPLQKIPVTSMMALHQIAVCHLSKFDHSDSDELDECTDYSSTSAEENGYETDSTYSDLPALVCSDDQSAFGSDDGESGCESDYEDIELEDVPLRQWRNNLRKRADPRRVRFAGKRAGRRTSPAAHRQGPVTRGRSRETASVNVSSATTDANYSPSNTAALRGFESTECHSRHATLGRRLASG